MRTRRRPQLSDEVASYVRELIMSGQLHEGQFVRLDWVAERLGISATPVREGLLALRGEGFVQLEPRRGFVVAPLSPADIRDLFLVQSEIAGELAARASQEISEDDLAGLASLQEALDQAARRGAAEEVERLNFQFHRVINRAARSAKLAWFLSVAVRYVPRQFYATIDGWPEASVHDHSAILDALRRRDPQAARATMREHIIHSGDLLAENLERRQPTVSDAREAAASTGYGEDPPSGRRSEQEDTVSDAREAAASTGYGEHPPSGRRSSPTSSVSDDERQ